MKRLTSKQLREIASKIEGPRPGLWILSPYRRTRAKTGPESLVVRTHSEVTAKPRSSSDFWDDLVRVQLPAAVSALSTINILLARFTRQLDLHQALSEKFLHSDLRSRPDPFEPGRRPDYVLIFNRIGVLTTLKGLIGIPEGAGEKEIYNDHQIGRLMLRANDFITSTKFRQPDNVLDDLDLAVELLPTWELSNERDLAYGLTRTYLMATRHLFAQELRLKLVENERGEPKALRQLARGIQAIREGKVKTALKQDKPLYPLVVVYEPSLESFGINSFLNSEFQRILAAIGGDADVKPLTVMSVQELEILLAQTSVGHVTWSEVLEVRFDGTRVRATSTHQAIYDILKAKSKEFRRNAFLLRNFEEIYKTIEKRYRTGDPAEGSLV